MAKFTPGSDPELDAAVAARMQKDLEGYTERYRAILDARHVKYAKELAPVWQRAEKRLAAQIKDLFRLYSDGQGKLSEDKLKTMQYGISRLEQLKGEISRVLGGIVDPLNTKLGNNLAYQYTNSYYYQAFALEQALEIQTIVPLVTENQVLGVLANPWLPDGATYSERIRSSTTYLASKMYQAVGKAAVEGWGWNQTARTIQATAQEGYYNSVRLARTELNRAAAQGANNLYMQNADVLDGKRWNATLDSRTAAKDAKNDGKIYPLDYDTPENPARAGERIPNHPNCRCSWTPYVNYLGVSTRERIARGAGDSTEKFGERIYTKARTYEEYAKERGLPDLNERLANENPKRYLRPGEDLSAFGAAVGVLPGVLAARAAAIAKLYEPAIEKTWVDNFKESIPIGGPSTEAEVRALGAQVREQLEKEAAEKLLALEKEIAELGKRREELADEMFELVKDDKPYEHISKLRNAVDEKYIAALNARDNGDSRRELVRNVLKQLRPIGTNGGKIVQPWVKGSRKEVKAILEEVREYLPTAWLEKSGTSEILTKNSKRGYYLGAWGKDTAIISLSGQGASSLRRVAFHEFGHRFEDVVPGIFKLEREFYRRRTAGESLQWLGPGYKTSETSRFDEFLSKYMGKEYRDDYHELLSMGLESLYTGSYDLAKDQDFYDFILGLVSAI